MWLLAKRTAVVLSTILLFASVIAFVYGSRRILITFLFAIFFAYLLEPWVLRVQLLRTLSRGSRGIAILEVYVIVGAILVLLALLVSPRVAVEVRRLGEALPGLLENLNSGRIARQLGVRQDGRAFADQILEMVERKPSRRRVEYSKIWIKCSRSMSGRKSHLQAWRCLSTRWFFG